MMGGMDRSSSRALQRHGDPADADGIVASGSSRRGDVDPLHLHKESVTIKARRSDQEG